MFLELREFAQDRAPALTPLPRDRDCHSGRNDRECDRRAHRERTERKREKHDRREGGRREESERDRREAQERSARLVLHREHLLVAVMLDPRHERPSAISEHLPDHLQGPPVSFRLTPERADHPGREPNEHTQAVEGLEPQARVDERARARRERRKESARDLVRGGIDVLDLLPCVVPPRAEEAPPPGERDLDPLVVDECGRGPIHKHVDDEECEREEAEAAERVQLGTARERAQDERDEPEDEEHRDGHRTYGNRTVLEGELALPTGSGPYHSVSLSTRV